MGIMIPNASDCFGALGSAKAQPVTGCALAIIRLPTDPLYYADVSVKNMVVGSRWAIGYDDSGTFTILDEGDCTATDFTIPSAPAYSSTFLLELRVRKGTTAPKYKPYKTYAYHSKQGATIYVSQVADPVA